MNAEPTNLTTVSDADLALVERELERTPQPRSTHDLAGKLAFEKTAVERTQDVKKYDPYARYDVGDFIQKEYKMREFELFVDDNYHGPLEARCPFQRISGS